MVACSRRGAVRALARTAGPGAGGGGCFPPARPRMVRITPRLHYHFPVMATGGLFQVSRDPSGNGSRRSSPLAPRGLLPGRVRCQCVASPAADGRSAPGAVCVPGVPRPMAREWAACLHPRGQCKRPGCSNNGAAGAGTGGHAVPLFYFRPAPRYWEMADAR